MEDDEGTKNWAEREAAKERRKAEEAAKERDKSAHDTQLKNERGLALFKELHKWMEDQAKSFSHQTPDQAFQVGKIVQTGGLDDHHPFKVSSTTTSERWPMEVSYQEPPFAPRHEVTVDCGVRPHREYTVSVRGDDLLFETPEGQLRTIKELGSELLDLWRSVRT